VVVITAAGGCVFGACMTVDGIDAIV